MLVKSLNYNKGLFDSLIVVYVYFFISFTLYPVYSRVGKGNIVLRHSVPNIPLNLSRHCLLNELNGFWPKCHSEEMKICYCAMTAYLYSFNILIECNLW